jgi:hypothetical protein
MAWVDANVYCGLGETYPDDQPTTSSYRNYNDGRSDVHGMFARVDTACWGVSESHEIMHTLGSVQDTAPHATSNGHCYDEYDRMCYDDDGTNNGVVATPSGNHAMTFPCSATTHEQRFDCNHDDYFNTAPAAGSYLATHWDSAKNSFLALNGLPDPPATLVLDPRSTAMKVSWTAPSSNGGSPVTNYVVGIYKGSTLAQPVYTTPDATTLTKDFTGLTNGTTYTVQVQAKTANGNSLPASGTATPQALGVSFAPPTAVGSPVIATFTEAVKNVSSADFQVALQGASTPLAGNPSCKTVSGAAVSCATGPVKTAQLVPALITGEHYTATVNPPGATTTVTAVTGGAAVPTTTSSMFRALTAEELKSTQLWATTTDAAAHGGSYIVERTAGAYATIAFNGTGITWYTMTGPDQGTADVYVDNVLKLSAVNNYSAAKTFGVSHTLKIVVKGAKGTASATNTRVVLDGVQTEGASEIVTPAFSRYWPTVSWSGASSGKYIVDDVAGASDSIKFRGTGITVWFVRTIDSGRVTPKVDSTAYSAVDLYNSATGLYGVQINGLTDAQHTITLTVAGTKQAASTGTKVAVDRFVAA